MLTYLSVEFRFRLAYTQAYLELDRKLSKSTYRVHSLLQDNHDLVRILHDLASGLDSPPPRRGLLHTQSLFGKGKNPSA